MASLRTYPCTINFYTFSAQEKKYVGSTVLKLSQRKAIHKRDYLQWSQRSKLHKEIEELGWSNFKMRLLFRKCCASLEEAVDIENNLIVWIGTLNERCAGVRPEDREQARKEANARWYKKVAWKTCVLCPGKRWNITSSRKRHLRSEEHIAKIQEWALLLRHVGLSSRARSQASS